MSLTRRSRSSAPFLTDNSESAASYIVCQHSATSWIAWVLTLHSASKTWLKYTRISPFATLAMLYMLSHA